MQIEVLLIIIFLFREISKLTKLCDLYLDSNLLSTLPPTIKRLSQSLTQLSIAENTIQTFPKEVVAHYSLFLFLSLSPSFLLIQYKAYSYPYCVVIELTILSLSPSLPFSFGSGFNSEETRIS
jgi:Leucine-rich repeat (LRR) protein